MVSLLHCIVHGRREKTKNITHHYFLFNKFRFSLSVLDLLPVIVCQARLNNGRKKNIINSSSIQYKCVPYFRFLREKCPLKSILILVKSRREVTNKHKFYLQLHIAHRCMPMPIRCTELFSLKILFFHFLYFLIPRPMVRCGSIV